MIAFLRRLNLRLLVDIGLAVTLFVLSLTTVTSDGDGSFSRSHDSWQIALIALQTLPLAARRVLPGPVLVVVAAAFLTDRVMDYPGSAAALGAPIALHAVASELPRRKAMQWAMPVAGFLVGFTTLGALTYDSVNGVAVITTALFTLLPFGLGLEVHDRRMRTEQAERRAVELERRQAEQAREAVRQERSRIARELHDVVAHQMAVMTVQAAAARRVIDRDTTAARDALSAVESAGREALDEMRRLLGVLRTDEEQEPIGPQPGLDQLSGLAGQMRDAGLDVVVDIEGTPRALPPGVDLNAFRIIQESLTNALKHGGPGVTAWVRIVWGSDLAIEVTDDGRGGAESMGGDGTTGHGLLGMQERITIVSGNLSAGPRPGGGFRVAARIPLEAA